jgi:hypothetical protein
MRSRTKSRTLPPPPAPKPRHPAVTALGKSRWLYVLLSVLVLAPCYWQSRIQAGDLSSHIYNAWLAQLIESGRIQGLKIASQTTNILFDLMLGGLFQRVGAEAAQRISVALAVLIFTWGAFTFVRAVSGRKPWQIFPCIVMLAYGWVFHMGFFDFYLSLGLCFWAMALLWKPNPVRVVAAIAILILAYMAHALPVAWALGLAAYRLIAGRLPTQYRTFAMAGALVAIVILRAIVASTMGTNWFARQIVLITGIDQMWVFDAKYYAVLIPLGIIWLHLFLNLTRSSGLRQVVSGMGFQFCVISAGAVFILPTTIQIPGFHHALTFIADRMSLPAGICVCALLARAPGRRFDQGALIAVALVFFGFLYLDDRALNSFEDRMRDTVAAIPAGQRVISALDDPSLRVNALTHMIDRVCIGHCYSYANYEPSTAQFRIRAEAENPYVAYTYQDSWLMQVGAYAVKERDLPLYQVDLDASGRMVWKSLRAGVQCGSTTWKVLGDLW